MRDEDMWFEPKRFGYGSGLPVRWQGWALLSGYFFAVLWGALHLAHHRKGLFVGIVLVLTVPLLVISARHTRGGWRWRWGGE